MTTQMMAVDTDIPVGRYIQCFVTICGSCQKYMFIRRLGGMHTNPYDVLWHMIDDVWYCKSCADDIVLMLKSEKGKITDENIYCSE